MRGFSFRVIGTSLEIRLISTCINECSHQGDCEADVKRWVHQLRPMLDEIPAHIIATVLKPYGAWNEEELKDHEQNLVRLLWSAAGQAKDEGTRWVYMEA